MKYRKLRIAWSVGWGVVAVLLVVLWVRSKSSWERAWLRPFNGNELCCYSFEGCFFIELLDEQIADPEWYGTRKRDLTGTDLNSLVSEGIMNSYGFAFRRRPEVSYVSMPHWSLILTATLVGAFPWLRWRFSLRTLLIVTTLVAVALGLIMWLSKR